MGATVLGDDLYSRQPLCEIIFSVRLNFILVCKPQTHKILYSFLTSLEATNNVKTVKVTRRHGKKVEIDTYRFVNQVPGQNGVDAIDVNWCELITTDKNGNVIYKNSFITNHLITIEPVTDIVKAGRALGQVENENNNTLKTKGYHFEANQRTWQKTFIVVVSHLEYFGFFVSYFASHDGFKISTCSTLLANSSNVF